MLLDFTALFGIIVFVLVLSVPPSLRLEKEMGSSNLPSARIPEMMEFARVAALSRDIGSLRAGTLQLIRRIFRSDSTILWLTGPNNRAVEPLEVNVQKQFFPMYRDYYYRKNPFDLVNMGSFKRKTLSMEQVVPYRDFQKTEYYNDFIRPQKIRRQMVVYIRVNDNMTSVICTHRCRDSRFKREDRAAGDLVSSHLSDAFERIQMIEEVKKKGSFFQMILDSTDLGIAVLDLERKPIFINGKAAGICAGIRKETLTGRKHRRVDPVIPPAVLKDCEAVEKIHGDNRNAGVDSSPARKRVMRVSSLEKCLFRSRIVDSPMTGSHRPLFLVTMESLPVYPEIDDRAVRRDYNLTKREAEIVSYIFRGYRNAEIAENLFISEGTVKNHLRNIFEKAGVRNRTSLIHKVLSL